MDPQTEEIDYCDRTCGNNVQLICTTIFSKSPFCRADWNKGKKMKYCGCFCLIISLICTDKIQ